MDAQSYDLSVEQLEEDNIRLESTVIDDTPVTHALDQGAPEWIALRAQRFTASEAPAQPAID